MVKYSNISKQNLQNCKFAFWCYCLIMKRIIFVIFLCLITNASYAATEKVYLKCKKVVTQNKSTGSLADIFEVGNFGQIVLSEILISSKSSKITV